MVRQESLTKEQEKIEDNTYNTQDNVSLLRHGSSCEYNLYDNYFPDVQNKDSKDSGDIPLKLNPDKRDEYEQYLDDSQF